MKGISALLTKKCVASIQTYIHGSSSDFHTHGVAKNRSLGTNFKSGSLNVRRD